MCFRCENTQSAGARQWNIDSLQLRFRSPLAMQKEVSSPLAYIINNAIFYKSLYYITGMYIILVLNYHKHNPIIKV